ncbi:hypothetical protein ABPG73_017866 [Tetrahymena malaccensis]
MQPQLVNQQVDINYQQGQINYGKSPYILQSPYKLSSSSMNSQVSKNNVQYQSPVENFQRSLKELTQYQQQMQYNQNLQAIHQNQQNQLQQMSINNTPLAYTSYQSPVKQDYVLFERQDPYQRFNGNSLQQNKVNNMYQQQQLPYQTISQIQNRQPNVYQIATLNTIGSQDRLNTQLTEQNYVRQSRQNNNGYINSDVQSINSAYNSRYTDQQDKSMYGYQINKQRQFMSPDQQSVRSQRKKIFSPISDKTIGSIESDITSFQKYRSGGVTNRLANSQQVEKESLFKSQNQNRFSTQQFNSGQSVMSSSIQNRMYSSESDKKRIFSPVMDYSKLSPLTKENNKIEEEEEIYKGNAIQTGIQPTQKVQNNYYSRYNYQEEDFSSPKFQDFDQNDNDAFNQSDDLAEKFYEAQTNDREQSSYQSFNNQNMSYDGFQNFEYERTKEQISPEKNSALKYLQEERVKRQLDGEFKKKQELEQTLAKRRKLFFQGVVGLQKVNSCSQQIAQKQNILQQSLVKMQQFHSFGELRNSQHNQQNYYLSPTSARNLQQGFQRGREYSFQYQNPQQNFSERRQNSLFSNNINMKNELLSSQSMNLGQEKSNSPIRQIYEAPPYPNNCAFSYSNMYPITYQTVMSYNHRYQDYSPNTKQNTLVEADSLENTIKKQQDRDFYKYQLQQMSAQQNQLQQLNLSPFQSQAITPQKNNSNRQSSQNFQNKTYQAQQNFIKTDDQDFQQLKYTSPASQLDKTNRVLFGNSPSTQNQEQTIQDQRKRQQQQQQQQQPSRQYQSENKEMYDSIHRNVNQIVSKYFKPLSKEDKIGSEKLETQSMHQLSSNYKSNYENQNTRNNSQIQDKTWSPLFTQNSRGNNNSNHSIYSQPFEIQTVQTQPDSQQYKLFQDKPSFNPSYSKYITPETEKILQKWNSIGVGDVRNQIDQRNRNTNQQYEINNQTKINTQQTVLREQPYQQQQYFEFNAKQSFNPQFCQQENIQNYNSFMPKQESANSPKNGLSNKNYVLFEKGNENHSQSLLNQGFIQSNPQTLQNIQQLNTINNISNIDQQTRFDISIQEQNRIYQETQMNSLEEFDSFEKDKDENIQNQNNIIYDSNEMFDLKNKGIQSRKKANNHFKESEVFQSLQSTQADNILTPSCLNLPYQEINNRKIQQEQQSESHQDLTLKSLLNIPKSIQKISQTTEDQKKQKTKSLLAFQVVSCILILVLLYILLIK